MIQSDATSTVWAWTKGSKNKHINNPIQQALQEAAKKGIHFKAEHIAGEKNRRADWISRNVDPKNYHLRQDVYHWVCRKLQTHPVLDLLGQANKTVLQLEGRQSLRGQCLEEDMGVPDQLGK